ncbi:hypothetical protein SpCBS45565_g07794 [Spizellomyces sp. 'palustris']|nr:hypothetical protein SpCBS45565_g07794 [Spizellomyces sp. 'palustris']
MEEGTVAIANQEFLPPQVTICIPHIPSQTQMTLEGPAVSHPAVPAQISFYVPHSQLAHDSGVINVAPETPHISLESYVLTSITRAKETPEFLGPLPSHISAFADPIRSNRTYYTDSALQTCSWIDPRTFATRKHDILEVCEYELPYGWEEYLDTERGIVYYIDHIGCANYPLGPWTAETREAVLRDCELKERRRLEYEARKLEEEIELERQKKLQMEEQDRRRLEEEMLARQAQLLSASATDNLLSELTVLNEKVALGRCEMALTSSDSTRLQEELSFFEVRLGRLQAINAQLEGQEQRLVETAQATNMELSEVRNMIDIEAAQRAALEDYVDQLRVEAEEATVSGEETVANDSGLKVDSAEADQEHLAQLKGRLSTLALELDGEVQAYASAENTENGALIQSESARATTGRDLQIEIEP